jgi:hypothetical protein
MPEQLNDFKGFLRVYISNYIFGYCEHRSMQIRMERLQGDGVLDTSLLYVRVTLCCYFQQRRVFCYILFSNTVTNINN